MARFRVWDWSRVTDDEYRANLNGMNTFFGAVIGFVLADVIVPTLIAFAQLLVVTAAVVISILYICVSKHRWLYGTLTVLIIWALRRVLSDGAGDPGRLQVTLAVWTLMTIGLEAWRAWQQQRDARRSEPVS